MNRYDIVIAEDWGNGIVCIMHEDEADDEHEKQLDATKDGTSNPHGFGSRPEYIGHYSVIDLQEDGDTMVSDMIKPTINMIVEMVENREDDDITIDELFDEMEALA